MTLIPISRVGSTVVDAEKVIILDGNGDQVTSFGSGTQYTEGDTDATITGSAILWEDTGDTLRPVSAAKPLPVNIVSGAASGTEYTEGDTDATITGTAMLMEGAANTLVPVQGNATDGVLVNLGANNDVTVTSGSITVTQGTATNLKAQAEAYQGGTAVGAANPLQVTLANGSVPSHAVTNVGTFAVQDSEKIKDNGGFTDGTTKVMPTGYIYDEVAGTALTENDIAAARINVNRAQVATIEDGTTRGRYATVTASNALKVDGSAVTQPVSDASGSLTVDAPVATPVFVRLSDGAAAISTLPVSLASVPSHAVTVASGGIASGAVASGAFASGSVASGAYASGSIASGAMVDITNLSTPITPATATATKAMNLGAEYRSTLPTWTNTQQGALQVGTRGSLHVELWNTDSATPVPSGSGNATGALRVEVANNGTGLITANPATAANWGIYVEDNGETAGGNLMMAGSVRRDTAASSSGTTGDNSTINTSAEGALWAALTPTTTSGCSVFMATSADGSTALTSTAQAIKASAGNLYGYYIGNPNASAVYVHLYNTAAASVTVGTTNPLVTFYIPASTAANVAFPYPITFSNAGWSCSATTTGGGNTAPSSALEAVFFYK